MAARHASRRKENDGYVHPISATVPLQLNHSNLHYNLHLSSCPSSLPFRRIPLPDTPTTRLAFLSIQLPLFVLHLSFSRSLFLVGFAPFGIYIFFPRLSTSIETTLPTCALLFLLHLHLASRTCDSACLSLPSSMRACVCLYIFLRYFLRHLFRPCVIMPERCAIYTIYFSLSSFIQHQ